MKVTALALSLAVAEAKMVTPSTFHPLMMKQKSQDYDCEYDEETWACWGTDDVHGEWYCSGDHEGNYDCEFEYEGLMKAKE